MTEPQQTPIRTNVTACARCGGNHPQMTFEPLTNAPCDITHWATCPALQEPILLHASTVDEDTEGPPE